MGICFGRNTHRRMTDEDSCYEATSLAEPNRIWRYIPKWLQRRPKFVIGSTNPYSNLGQEEGRDRELYNPVVDGRELWPHESPDVWAVPADEPANERASNNNLRINSKEAIASGSHSSIDLEWENDGVLPRTCDVSQRRPSTEHHERMSLNSVTSHRSRHSSLSNDLEWDEDFADPYTFQSLRVDFDTEQLIAEIDKMTEKALKETEHEDKSLPPFESLDSMASL
ncbi:uncharacterized protein LOC100902883 [Galendromus occidentalis]|uniref:Uncharacterized protein LOC100902883 n=1 Tax=Galendromus occidentalis TaxID=34638 RepID=A0AAJ6QT80_9ACAR|nr:uncharacterized protein LOC100902883 [Galendromus occidentalis]